MVSVAMSDAQSAELLLPPNQQGPSREGRAPQRSFSLSHVGPLSLPNDNYSRRKSAFATVAPKPVESTFWKNSGKVPGSIKAVKTPPRGLQPVHITPSTSTPVTSTDSYTNTSTTHASDVNQPPSPPKSQPSSENNSPNHSPRQQRDDSPHLQRVASTSRSKSTSSIPMNKSSSSNSISSSNGYGEFVHHCMEWKSCGRVGETTKLDRFKKILSDPVIDMETLKKNCWKGIPGEVRSHCWKLLLGYLPANADRRESTLARKRQEYHENVEQYYNASKTENESAILKQIQIDLPRTNPKMPLFQQIGVQQILERILYIWAIRHPASDYVQGINDIATPFFVVFLSEFVDNVDSYDINNMRGEFLNNIEADTYWCLSKFLDGIQDYYTFAQPGIQRMTFKLQELVGRVDQPLVKHLQTNEVNFIDFSFRWMNCVLVREFPLSLVARMWDTYLAEGESFSIFHLYVCAAFLKRWSAELRLLDFQEIFMFLQRPPTNEWTCKDIELMLSEAYLWMETFQNAPAHLKSSIP